MRKPIIRTLFVGLAGAGVLAMGGAAAFATDGNTADHASSRSGADTIHCELADSVAGVPGGEYGESAANRGEGKESGTTTNKPVELEPLPSKPIDGKPGKGPQQGKPIECAPGQPIIGQPTKPVDDKPVDVVPAKPLEHQSSKPAGKA